VAYVRRLLARQRLYGTKVGSVWAIFPEDVEAFKRLRRPPGRPRKIEVSPSDSEMAGQMAGERAHAGTKRRLRQKSRRRTRNPGPASPHAAAEL